MVITYSTLSEEVAMKYSERLGLAGQVTLIGVLTVFSVLAILMGCLYAFQYFSYTLPNKKKKSAAAPVAAEEKTETVLPTSSTEDTQLIAVLTAAVAAYESSVNGNNGGFRVVSFKRAGKKAPWNGEDIYLD